jgi:hypothetical protein
MDQRLICLFLAIKGFLAQPIHNELVAVLGPDADRILDSDQISTSAVIPPVSLRLSEEPPNSVIDGAILDALDKQPFSSFRELAKLTGIPIATVHRH